MISEYQAFLYNGDVLFLQTINMKKNEGALDRIIRLVVAAIIVTLYFKNLVAGTLAIVLLVIAAILVITGATGFCGLYTLFGISTCPKKK
jgi:hypothetical protein